MADNFWDNSDADNDGNNANNWSLGTVPAGTDVAVFDTTSVANCLFSGNISCAGINVNSTYSGDIDFATFNLTTSGAMTFDGSGIFDCGTGTLTCSGNFDNQDQGTWTRGSSTVVMDTDSTTMLGGSTKDLHNLTISGNVTLLATTSGSLDVQNDFVLSVTKTFTVLEDFKVFGDSTIAGTLSIDTGDTFNDNAASQNLAITGSITGAGTWRLQNGTVTDASGTIDVANMIFRETITLAPGTYGNASTTMLMENHNASARSLTLSAGAFVFPGTTTFDMDRATVAYAVNFALATSIRFSGDVIFSETGGGTISLTKLTVGDITFSGANDYTDSTAAGLNLGDIVIEDTRTLLTAIECDDFIMDVAGTIDPGIFDITANGAMDFPAGAIMIGTAIATTTITVGGNLTLDGQNFTFTNGVWNLTVTGTAVASGTGSVQNSNAGGGTEITASAGPWTDNGTNTNWDFGVGGALPSNLNRIESIILRGVNRGILRGVAA